MDSCGVEKHRKNDRLFLPFRWQVADPPVWRGNRDNRAGTKRKMGVPDSPETTPLISCTLRIGLFVLRENEILPPIRGGHIFCIERLDMTICKKAKGPHPRGPRLFPRFFICCFIAYNFSRLNGKATESASIRNGRLVVGPWSTRDFAMES